MSKKPKNLVFVYGTLKEGHGNNCLLKDNNAVYMGDFKTLSGLSLYVAGLPYLVKRELGTGAEGELYMVDDNTLSKLDNLEGHPSFYKRELIKLQDYYFEVWAYIYQENGCDSFSGDMPMCSYRGTL